MKVFILIGSWDYEGERILSVSSNKEQAEKQLIAEKSLSYNNYDEYEIEEYEVLK